MSDSTPNTYVCLEDMKPAPVGKTVLFIADCSPSMGAADNNCIAELREGLAGMCQAGEQIPNSKFGLISFANDTRAHGPNGAAFSVIHTHEDILKLKFYPNKEWENNITPDTLPLYGSKTALYDTVQFVATAILIGNLKVDVIAITTDGADNASTCTREVYENLLALLKIKGVTVLLHVIGNAAKVAHGGSKALYRGYQESANASDTVGAYKSMSAQCYEAPE